MVTQGWRSILANKVRPGQLLQNVAGLPRTLGRGRGRMECVHTRRPLSLNLSSRGEIYVWAGRRDFPLPSPPARLRRAARAGGLPGSADPRRGADDGGDDADGNARGNPRPRAARPEPGSLARPAPICGPALSDGPGHLADRERLRDGGETAAGAAARAVPCRLPPGALDLTGRGARSKLPRRYAFRPLRQARARPRLDSAVTLICVCVTLEKRPRTAPTAGGMSQRKEAPMTDTDTTDVLIQVAGSSCGYRTRR